VSAAKRQPAPVKVTSRDGKTRIKPAAAFPAKTSRKGVGPTLRQHTYLRALMAQASERLPRPKTRREAATQIDWLIRQLARSKAPPQ
jgi:hypothetical protein